MIKLNIKEADEKPVKKEDLPAQAGKKVVKPKEEKKIEKPEKKSEPVKVAKEKPVKKERSFQNPRCEAMLRASFAARWRLLRCLLFLIRR